jgi:Fe-Mn family superoxide dismutase
MNKSKNSNVYGEKPQTMERRYFLKKAGLLTAAACITPVVFSGNTETGVQAGNAPSREFPPLPYSYDALEPYIDAKTMEIHYDKHHRAYFNNFISAVKGTAIEKSSLEEIFAGISKQPEAVRNNAGGYYNHTFFWNSMAKGGGQPSGELMSAINKKFGSFDEFRQNFSTAARTRFGSGWAWLYMKPDKTLAVDSTPNQDNPLMDISNVKGIPLLTLDVWEHAYYLKYQNRRPEYIEAFWNVINWKEVEKRFSEAVKA